MNSPGLTKQSRRGKEKTAGGKFEVRTKFLNSAKVSKPSYSMIKFYCAPTILICMRTILHVIHVGSNDELEFRVVKAMVG